MVHQHDVVPPNKADINTEMDIEVQPSAPNLGVAPSRTNFGTKVDKSVHNSENVRNPSDYSMVPRHFTSWADAFGDLDDENDDYEDDKVEDEWLPLRNEEAKDSPLLLDRFEVRVNIEFVYHQTSSYIALGKGVSIALDRGLLPLPYTEAPPQVDPEHSLANAPNEISKWERIIPIPMKYYPVSCEAVQETLGGLEHSLSQAYLVKGLVLRCTLRLLLASRRRLSPWKFRSDHTLPEVDPSDKTIETTRSWKPSYSDKITEAHFKTWTLQISSLKTCSLTFHVVFVECFSSFTLSELYEPYGVSKIMKLF
ncbi:hypothetical protein FNV43_RR27273 [Rhamnella rubrinervis]|uniref:Uncharacterized protein n=1 Tax=Rhamnella rubrinervis TaxID=2594499 RepID=A0A8K0DP43_9ROSA|nr:hypothetical protein FNV43_RR27273 [Rhamnella rubrinervis]